MVKVGVGFGGVEYVWVWGACFRGVFGGSVFVFMKMVLGEYRNG